MGLVASALIVTTAIIRHGSSAKGPWSPHTAHLRDRLQMLGLPALAAEGEVVHDHAHLDVYVDGNHVTIPAEIGVGSRGSFYSPLHTHDTSGIVHVESATRRRYTLGQFFGVWGVRLTDACIDGHCRSGNRTLLAFVDGRRARHPATIELRPHAEIVVVLGTPTQRPKPVPSSYPFPPGV